MRKRILSVILMMVVFGGVLQAETGPKPTPRKKSKKMGKRQPQLQMLKLMRDATASQMRAVAKMKQLAFKSEDPHTSAKSLLTDISNSSPISKGL